MIFVPGDRVMVENPWTGYNPPWGVGTVAPAEPWNGWVWIELTHGKTAGETHQYPVEAVRHSD